MIDEINLQYRINHSLIPTKNRNQNENIRKNGFSIHDKCLKY
jgi:hypothetical protein